VATLGVLGWRLVNFWLPIPAGAIAYVSLKLPRGAGPRAWRAAMSALIARPARLAENEPPGDQPPGDEPPEDEPPEDEPPEDEPPEDQPPEDREPG
jgi:hypothetical protein